MSWVCWVFHLLNSRTSISTSAADASSVTPIWSPFLPAVHRSLIFLLLPTFEKALHLVTLQAPILYLWSSPPPGPLEGRRNLFDDSEAVSAT